MYINRTTRLRQFLSQLLNIDLIESNNTYIIKQIWSLSSFLQMDNKPKILFQLFISTNRLSVQLPKLTSWKVSHSTSEFLSNVYVLI